MLSKQFMTKKELATFLCRSIYTIDRWCAEKREIPFIRMGRRVMFDVTDVMAWVEKNKNKPGSN